MIQQLAKIYIQLIKKLFYRAYMALQARSVQIYDQIKESNCNCILTNFSRNCTHSILIQLSHISFLNPLRLNKQLVCTVKVHSSCISIKKINEQMKMQCFIILWQKIREASFMAQRLNGIPAEWANLLTLRALIVRNMHLFEALLAA